MSSPIRKTSLSARIADASASRTASRYESSGIDVLQSILWLRIGSVLRELDRRLDDLVYLVVERLPLLVRHLQLLAQAHDRILLGRLAAIFLRAVDLRVADVVAVHAEGLDV